MCYSISAGQRHTSNCLLNISTWMSDKYLTFNMSKSKLVNISLRIHLQLSLSQLRTVLSFLDSSLSHSMSNPPWKCIQNPSASHQCSSSFPGLQSPSCLNNCSTAITSLLASSLALFHSIHSNQWFFKNKDQVKSLLSSKPCNGFSFFSIYRVFPMARKALHNLQIPPPLCLSDVSYCSFHCHQLFWKHWPLCCSLNITKHVSTPGN